jgi:hypothetical protein
MTGTAARCCWVRRRAVLRTSVTDWLLPERLSAAKVAETLGIDLATATMGDSWRLSAFYGARMGDKR